MVTNLMIDAGGITWCVTRHAQEMYRTRHPYGPGLEEDLGHATLVRSKLKKRIRKMCRVHKIKEGHEYFSRKHIDGDLVLVAQKSPTGLHTLVTLWVLRSDQTHDAIRGQ